MESYQNYSLDCGHNCFPDTGATGIRQEDDLTKEVSGLVIQKLRLLGKTVTDCTPYGQRFNSVGGSLGYRVQQSNNSKSQLHICIHFNKFNGSANGVEVFAISQVGREIAQRVCAEISSMGFYNRGVKDGSGLYVVKYTNCPCILVECAFCDSESDMSKYNAEGMANAIVKAVTGQVVQGGTPVQNPQPIKVVAQVPIQPKPQPQVDQTILRIQQTLNRLKIRDDNENALSEDGVKGMRTEQVIRRFQSICGIEQDSIWGNQSQNCADQILVKPLCGLPYVQRIPTRYIQWRLGTSIDGVFGNDTAYAVSQWQSRNGLDSDGIVGKISWGVLIG